MKYYLLIIIILLNFYGFSQESIHDPNTNSVPVSFERTNQRYSVANQTSAWYNYGFMLQETFGTSKVEYFRASLFPDSTVLTDYKSGIGYVSRHSMGQTFDPGSPVFDNGTTVINLSNTVSYRLDSIEIPYRYFRYQTNAEDTLIVQIFEHSQMKFSTFDTLEKRPYAYVPYDYAIRKGEKPVMEFNYLLSDKDTTGSKQGSLKIPINNFIVKAGEKFAATITYFPGNPYSLNDTLSPYTTPKPVNKINSLIVYEYKDNSKYIDKEFYNNSLTTNKSVRYNKNQNNWNGKYIAGTAWLDGYTNMDMSFYITTLNLDVENNKKSNISAKAYPNPIQLDETITIEFSLGKESMVTIAIMDITGKTIKTINKTHFKAGLNNFKVPLTGLTTGVYLCNVKTNESDSILKINIQ